jgi:hypothetical protein
MPAYSFKRRFVTPIRIGLGLPIRPEDEDPEATTLLRPKLQTIREHGKRRHAREGEAVYLYHAMRTKQCFKIGEALCTGSEAIVILLQKKGRRRESIRLPGRHYDSIDGLDEFAVMDGFHSWHAMSEFWDVNHPGVTDFSGALIRWKPNDADGQPTKPGV